MGPLAYLHILKPRNICGLRPIPSQAIGTNLAVERNHWNRAIAVYRLPSPLSRITYGFPIVILTLAALSAKHERIVVTAYQTGVLSRLVCQCNALHTQHDRQYPYAFFH